MYAYGSGGEDKCVGQYIGMNGGLQRGRKGMQMEMRGAEDIEIMVREA